MSDDGARWVFHGELTIDDAADVLVSSNALPLPPSGVIDFRGLLQADSTALAVMLAVKRRAVAEGRSVTFTALPDAVKSLAVVYGIDKLVLS